MNKVLDILDSMEEIRQKAIENPKNTLSITQFAYVVRL